MSSDRPLSAAPARRPGWIEPRTVPGAPIHDLRRLAAEPARIAELSLEEAAGLLVELSALHAALAVRVRDGRAIPSRRQREDADEFMTPEEVAQRTHQSIRWVRRMAGKWPFTRRIGRKVLLFSRPGFEAYMRSLRT